MSLVCRVTTAHFSFLSTKEHSMAKEGTGFKSKVTVGESKTCKDYPHPFNERQLAWLTSVMAKGTAESSSPSSKLKQWCSDSLGDRRVAAMPASWSRRLPLFGCTQALHISCGDLCAIDCIPSW